VPRLLSLGALVVLAFLLARWSSRKGWDERRVLAVAAGALISLAVVAFTVDPLGHVPLAANTTFVIQSATEREPVRMRDH
jgi:hypothetical protein